MDKLELANYAYEREQKTNSFLKRMVYVDGFDFNRMQLSYSVRDKLYYDFIFLKSVIQYFEYNYSDYIPMFITLTLPAYYHNNKAMIKEGYIKLNDTFRSIQKTLSAYKIGYKYLRVCEPHKDLTPHFHIVLFIAPATATFAFVRNLIFRIKRKKGLGRTQVVKIDRTENTLKYVVKYLAKTLSSEYLNDLYFIKGYSSFYGIRLFTYSKMPLPRYVFKILLSQMSVEEKKEAIEKYGNYYLYLLDNTEIERGYDIVNSVEFPFSEKKYFVNIKYSFRKLFKMKFFKVVTFFDFSEYIEGKKNSSIDEFLIQNNLSINDYYYELDNIKIPLYEKFMSDLLYYNTEIDEYKYVSDIQVYKDNELIYQKSLNFIEYDYTHSIS